MSRKKYNILLIEDSNSDISIFRECLSELGAETELTILKTRSDLQNYFHMIRNGNGYKFDLIISDLYIPGANAFDILKDFRKHEIFINVPFIVMTGASSPEYFELCSKLGIHLFIKSADFNESVKNTSKILQLSK